MRSRRSSMPRARRWSTPPIWEVAATSTAYGIAVDSQGNANITGVTDSLDFPTANPFQPWYGGGWDAFVAKLSAAGSELVYSTYLGGSSTDYAYSIAVDSVGSAYVTGWTDSLNFPVTIGAFDTTCGCGWDSILEYYYGDAFVTKLDPTGWTLPYSTFLGGSSDDAGYSVAVDSAGSAYVTGYAMSSNFPTTGGSCTGGVFATKLNAEGSAPAYSTCFGGSSFSVGSAIAVDSGGNSYVAGQTYATDFPTVSPLQAFKASNSGYDAFVTKLSADGSAMLYSTYLGGRDWDYVSGIAVDSAGNAYVTGRTFSTDFPTTNPFQASSRSQWETGFVAKISPADAPGIGLSPVRLSFSQYVGTTSEPRP